MDMCNQDCDNQGLPCEVANCEHWESGDCNGPLPEHQPKVNPDNPFANFPVWNVVRHTISCLEEGVIAYQNDYRVFVCQRCARTWDEHTEVVCRQVKGGLGEYEVVWSCPCGYQDNPMDEHVCDCGEDPCITYFAFDTGTNEPRPCPNIGTPTP